jgi:hypothetical protein
MEEDHSLDELNTLSSTMLFKDLEEKSESILNSLSDCKQQVRRVVKRVQETKPPILNMKLKPRSSSKKWMQQQGLPEEPTLQEFLNTFLNLYAKENRLDLCGLAVYLRKEEAKLFHLPEGKVDIFEILSVLPILFH